MPAPGSPELEAYEAKVRQVAVSGLAQERLNESAKDPGSGCERENPVLGGLVYRGDGDRCLLAAVLSVMGGSFWLNWAKHPVLAFSLALLAGIIAETRRAAQQRDEADEASAGTVAGPKCQPPSRAAPRRRAPLRGMRFA